MKNKFFLAVLIFTAVVFVLPYVAHAQYSPESDFDFMIMGNNEWVRITGYAGDRREISIPPIIQGLPVTTIGHVAFRNNQLTGVTIPNSVIHIEAGAFADNHLTDVTIPDSVTYIGDTAFADNHLTNVTIGNSVTFIGPYAFAGNHLTSVSIGNSVAFIGTEAFADNQLTSITIGANVIMGIWYSPNGFEEAYINGGRMAGTYTRPSTASRVWTRQ